MEAIIKSAKQNNISRAQEYNPKYVGCMCALFSILIFGRALDNRFFYLFAGVSLIVFLLSRTKHCIPLLLFLLPFSTILKPSVDSISFFAILFFLVAAKFVVIRQRIDGWLFIGLMFFFAYNILFSGLGQLTTIVTMIAGFMMLYYLRFEEINAKSAIMTFSSGICLSSIIALLKSSLPIINTFVVDTMLRLGEDDYASRFSGLQGNPNYYTLDIIMALAAIIVIMSNSKKTEFSLIAYIAILSAFGMMSVSKSFLLTLVLLLLLWFIMSLRQGASKMMKFLFIILISAMVVYYFAYDSITVYLTRLLDDSSAPMADVTTGRVDIWLSYVEAIFDDFKILFFGNGLKTIIPAVGKGTHNTFLECIFNLGLIGSVVFLVLLKISMGKKIYKNALWLPGVVLFVRMLAIGILTYDNLWFYFMIIVILSKEYGKLKPA